MSVKEWQDKAEAFQPLDLKVLQGPLAELDAHLTLRTYIVGYTPTDADTTVWKALKSNRIASSYIKQGLMVNLCRWFRFIEDTVKPTVERPQAKAKVVEDAGPNYNVGLEGIEQGIVTRFPPEPSGYMHLGHAKAALLNDMFAHDDKFKGPISKMILRFDDTNPKKEKKEYHDAIVADLKTLKIHPDQVTYTSDHFDKLYELCLQMIKTGKAYADDSPKEVIKVERTEKKDGKNRNNTVEENLEHFQEMTKGTTEGARWSIRAKISMQELNGAMQDPVIYRCNIASLHDRTGDKWKVYPTYDFACPVVDSLEGITHALRTSEYDDRIPQYKWMLNALGMRHVHVWHFARLSFIKTVLSKRTLTTFVDEGKVWGWNDPRMPTVQGLLRRGMTVDALRKFILAQGPSKLETLMDWTTIWAMNKKEIDPKAARYTAIDTADRVPCTVTGAPAAPRSEDKDLHSKYAELGKKKVVTSQSIIITQEDAASLKEDEELTLMNWGNAIVRKIHKSLNPIGLLPGQTQKITGLDLELHLQGDFKTTEKKITWLSTDQELIPVKLYEFDHLITKDKLDDDDKTHMMDFVNPKTETLTECLADCNVASLQENAILQFDRKGYFRCDRAFKAGEPAVFFMIPTGKEKGATSAGARTMPTTTLPERPAA